jgi:hypothetical protein
MSKQDKSKDNKYLLLKYAGLAIQWAAIILMSVFAGRKIDDWLHISKPLLSWILPILGIFGMLFQVIRDTSTPKKKK